MQTAIVHGAEGPPLHSPQVDPYRLKGLEVYSTVLWHCKREVGWRTVQGGQWEWWPCYPLNLLCITHSLMDASPAF